MDALYSTKTLSVWQNKVILNASSHTHHNCNLVHSPEPNQITKLKLASTSCTLNLGAQETVSKWFLMSVRKFKTAIFSPPSRASKDEVKVKSLITGVLSEIFLYQMMSWLTLVARSNESVKFIYMGRKRMTSGHPRWWRASKARGLDLATAPLKSKPFTSIFNVY